jgi:hypothetical protein
MASSSTLLSCVKLYRYTVLYHAVFIVHVKKVDNNAGGVELMKTIHAKRKTSKKLKDRKECGKAWNMQH